MITETEQISAALAAAAALWPEIQGNRGRLLGKLIAEGHRAINAELEQKRQDYAAVVGKVAGIFGQQEYPQGYLNELRAEWPR
jgi:hypothetical protein